LLLEGSTPRTPTVAKRSPNDNNDTGSEKRLSTKLTVKNDNSETVDNM
jgi:hypothetical protein